MQTVKFHSDTELLNALRDDSRDAFRGLYERYWKDLYRMAHIYFRNQQDAEDAIHDMFVYIWEHRHRLEIDTSLKGYLHRALKHRIIRMLSRADLHQKAMDHLVNRLTEIQTTILDVMAASDVESTLSKAIESFPENMKKTFILRHEDYTVKEIADALGLADQTVRNNLAEAARRLKNTLSKEHPELYVTMAVYFLDLLSDP